MKARILISLTIALLLPSFTQGAQQQDTADAKKATEQQQKVKKTSLKDKAKQAGKDTTVWIEDQVTPATRWLEDAVQPLTIWMEKQVQQPQNSQADPATLAPNQKLAIEPSNTDISPEQAETIANQHFPGEILRTSLLSKQPKQYRVKLISPAGEIHLIYINAKTGAIIKPKPKAKN